MGRGGLQNAGVKMGGMQENILLIVSEIIHKSVVDKQNGENCTKIMVNRNYEGKYSRLFWGEIVILAADYNSIFGGNFDLGEFSPKKYRSWERVCCFRV